MKYDSLQDTRKHSDNVSKFMEILVEFITERAGRHDKSKTEEPEKPIFDEYTPKLKTCTYGSDEYKEYLNET